MVEVISLLNAAPTAFKSVGASCVSRFSIDMKVELYGSLTKYINVFIRFAMNITKKYMIPSFANLWRVLGEV